MYGLLFFCATSVAQKNNDFSEMLLEASSVLYSQPQQAIKITEHVLKNSENTNQKIKAYLLEARAYYVSGDYNLTALNTLEAKKLAEASEDFEMQMEINIFGIHMLNLLGLDLAAEKYVEFTQLIIGDNNISNKTLYYSAAEEILKANKRIELQQFSDAIPHITTAIEILKKIPNSYAEVETQVTLIETYSKAYNKDSTQAFLKTFKNKIEKKTPNEFLKMIVLNQLGEVYFMKKQYPNAQLVFDEALLIAEHLSNKPYRFRILENKAINSMAMGDTENFYSLKKVSAELSKEVETNEESAVNSVFNYTNANHTAKRDEVYNTQNRIKTILGSALLLLVLTWLGLRVRYRARIKQYEDFIRYFENRQKATVEKDLSQNDSIKKEVTKSLNIPKETEELLIQKLEQFENSTNFTKKDMSLAQLASQFDTNTKYLSEVINSHKGKNFNSYINELRINYIIDKLKFNKKYLQYKISYLAEESGFSSHSSFATVFKSVTGISPTVFIDILKSKKLVSKSSKIYEHAE
ncbi:helix-turn-helix transcriptional regulator [Aureisphaera sp. CAU 1614]|uniref:Helix-turn-helix transcriptional regulator n=1 Tax=Halomarinibacterium sedimenti TaxID=2857106 RepID=A0A9X1FNL8_9FLAO|nr:helix-turn-helix transcriptional regulator [Halomarinibacterium sedimenti]MBW2937746.1 helix-turn-helix transcriptional regulator [Halomarinibacterium sedimenti]